MGDPRMRVFYAFTGKGMRGNRASLRQLSQVWVNRTVVQLTCGILRQTSACKRPSAKLILCSEADVDRRYTNAIVDKIKRLTGNDCVNVKRKFKGTLSVRFNSKILAVSNNLLRLMDESARSLIGSSLCNSHAGWTTLRNPIPTFP